eukprot:7506927-Prorocentrum_lima.AAC.1
MKRVRMILANLILIVCEYSRFLALRIVPATKEYDLKKKSEDRLLSPPNDHMGGSKDGPQNWRSG